MYQNDDGEWFVDKFKQLKSDLFLAKLTKGFAWVSSFTIIAMISFAYFKMFTTSFATITTILAVIMTILVVVIFCIIFAIYKDNNAVMARLKKQIKNYTDLFEDWKQRKSEEIKEERELNKIRIMKMKSKLTEKQIGVLSCYTEKAKQVFKWLIVTKDGEVVVSDLKPEYNEAYETWFFDNVARTIQVGRNKKLAKKSKYTLTKVSSDGYASLGI